MLNDTFHQIASFDTTYQAKIDVYISMGHLHFYSREELEMVSKFIGFSKVQFVEYGQSTHQELCGLETRVGQRDVNTFVELTK